MTAPWDADAFLSAVESAEDLRDRAEVRPLDYVSWTPPQMALLRCPGRYVQLRTGNQFGKTWVGAAEAHFHCLGRHPYKGVPAGPIEAWVLCHSWSQSVAIQKKLWQLAPHDELVPGQSFDPVNGFRGKSPALRYKNGSVLRIKTVGMDTMDLESATLHYIWIDEPLGNEAIFGALLLRLRRTGGRIVITMTPATTGDLTWLRERCESGQITDLHFRMEPENFVPEGASKPLCTEDGRPMDAAWIEEEIANTPSYQRGVRCHGDWEFTATDKALEAFHRNRHVVPDMFESDVLPEHALEVCVGIDYGEDALRTCGVLVYVDTTSAHPRIFIMAEYAPEQGTTMDMDAAGLLGMLAATGDRWTDVDHVWADKKYEGRSTVKSARRLGTAIAKQLGTAGELKPSPRVAKRGLRNDHFWPSIRWLHEAMVRPGHFYVDGHCEHMIRSLETWDGRAKHPAKDIIDALRYALRHHWGKTQARAGRVLHRRF